MKKILHILAAALCVAVLILGPTLSGASARAEGERTSVKLSGCDSDADKYQNMGSMLDNKNYIAGGASIGVKSIMPCMHIGVGGADLSKVPFDEAYLEFYFFTDGANHSDYYAALVLSAQENILSNGMTEKDRADCFVWELQDFRDKLHDGWNYICLRLKHAKYTQGNYTKEQAYENIKFLTVADIASTKPGFENMGFEDKIAAGGMYQLYYAIDEVSVTNKPLDYGGADGDIEFTTVQRMEGIEHRNADAYIAGKDGSDFRPAAYIILYVLAGVIVATEVTLLILKTVRRKKQ